MGRFVNRPYRNYSLFISEAASLFNIHSSPRVIPVAFPGDIVQIGNACGEADSLPYRHEDQSRTVGRGLAPAEPL